MTTLKQLKRIEQLLEDNRLLNNKYLTFKNNVYYFVIKINDYTFKKSLKTDNFTYSNLLKYKILEVIRKIKNDDNELDVLKDTKNSYYTINNLGGNGLILTPENEEERLLLSEIEKTIIKKIKLISKDKKVSVSQEETRDIQTLKKSCDKYIDFKSLLVDNRVMMKYRQSIEYLFIFFGEKKLIKDITIQECNDFRTFLMKVPVRWKSKIDLKDKNLKLMIDKKMKILDKYEKVNIKTVDEIIVKTKSIFEYFLDNTLIYKNPFSKMSKLNTKFTKKRDFSELESSLILKYMKNKKLNQEFNFFKFGLMSGLRRGEILSIRLKDIDFKNKTIYINGTKTENSKRLMFIHEDLISTIKEQIIDKNREDLLFYNEKEWTKLTEKYREEKVGGIINEIIKIVVGENVKKFLDIHSLRKSFTQIIHLSNEFTHLEVQTILGHSTKNDVTDTHYILGKRDYKSMLEKINNIDFTNFLEVQKIQDKFDEEVLEFC
ncbi:tyrosine-type recombinase/integrase [Sulfurimonas sp.]|uniref:tyrosine-type recombinase/integrase n=1 Tax=Sulfurimonas sp. TaxID=2022749 RepID=UPI0025D9414B|nr:tyrosine-type recombinase/integrase [Sulfurimonas sp.]MBW6488436.1 tyrosine-type recombinase/integrase [Sulfurimonas sp.]